MGSSVIQTKLTQSQITRYVNYYVKIFFATYIKTLNPREIIQQIERQEELKIKLSFISKEILLPHFLENVKELIKQAKEKKSLKCIRVT